MPAGEWMTIRSAHEVFDRTGAVRPVERVDPSNLNVMPKLRATATNIPAIRAERLSRLPAHWSRHRRRRDGVAVHEPHRSRLRRRHDRRQRQAVRYRHRSLRISTATTSGNFRRGVAMNGTASSVVDSYLEPTFTTRIQRLTGDRRMERSRAVQDRQQFLEAASENIMFGGSIRRSSVLCRPTSRFAATSAPSGCRGGAPAFR